MASELTGRIAAVTGAGRGIGRATAVALAHAGVARVVILARTARQLEETAAEVEHAGAEAVVIEADLGAIDRIEDVVAEMTARAGHPDVLVNNAATVAPLGPTVKLTAREVLSAFELNVVAPVMLASLLAPAMVDRAWGRILNVSSGAVPHPDRAIGSGVYAATKTALEAHTVALAAELAGSGVCVNAYRPGIVDTPMQQWVREQDADEIGRELHDRFVDSHRSGRLIPPHRTAETLVARLESNASGQIWDVSDPR